MNKNATNYFSIFALVLHFALSVVLLKIIVYFLFFYELFYREL